MCQFGMHFWQEDSIICLTKVWFSLLAVSLHNFTWCTGFLHAGQWKWYLLTISFFGIFIYILLLCTGNTNVQELRVVARGRSWTDQLESKKGLLNSSCGTYSLYPTWIAVFCLSLRDDTKWLTRVHVSLNLNTITEYTLNWVFCVTIF